MSIRRRRSLARVGIATLITGGALLAVPVGPAGAATVTETFNFTGGAQTWIVPAGVTQVTIEVFGAQGGGGVGFGDQDGNVNNATRLGGLGGRAGVTITVIPGASLQINVGGQGTDGTFTTTGPFSATAGAGGFNGGGAGGGVATVGTVDNRCAAAGGGGGGASDVRQGGTALANRVTVAAGGGGAGAVGSASEEASGSNAFTGGAGGGSTGGDGTGGGVATGGTQVAAGTPGSGGAGVGADGSTFTSGPTDDVICDAGGGGGSGLFGGGADIGSGGGGSSSPTADTTTGVRAGNGLVTITYETPAAAPIVVTFTG